MTTETKLKVGLVLDDSLDTPDGVQQYVLTIGEWLSRQGHTVHYLVGETKRIDIINLHSLAHNYKVMFNGNHLSIPLPTQYAKLKQLLAAEQFDVLHIQTPYSPFMAGRLIRSAGSKTAVVGTFHILPYSRLVVGANYLLAMLNRHTGRRFDAMIANSLPSQRFADTVYKFHSTVIPNPFSLKVFTVNATHSDKPTILFLGRLVARKGATQLLRAVDLLVKQQLYKGTFQVIIGGKGPQLADLQQYVATQGLSEIVSFAGFVPEADKAAFLAQADVAVFPSLSGESFGISLLEAMAAAPGVVLGGDNPGYRSVLGPLAADQLVSPTTTSKFAADLANWLNNPARRTQAALAQRQYVKQYDIGTVGPQIVAVYNQALRSRRNVQ